MRRRAVPALLCFAVLAACAQPGPPAASLPRDPVHVVFFADDSTALGASAMEVVQDAARSAAGLPGARVRVLGFVAPDPGQAPLVSLSRARAQAVADELVRFGVARSRVEVQGRGAAGFDAVAPVEARRVEIRVGGN